MFNTLNHKGNANQHYTKIACHSSQIGNHHENKQQMLVRMEGGKEPSDTVGRSVN
jgi:hypothetical protein